MQRKTITPERLTEIEGDAQRFTPYNTPPYTMLPQTAHDLCTEIRRLWAIEEAARALMVANDEMPFGFQTELNALRQALGARCH